MDEQGLWNLFLVTGSPRVWLAMRGARQKQEQQEPSLPAFRAAQSKEI